MPEPRLSVTLSNYNHGHYLPEALTAICGQSRPADEIIVIDDASTDDSVDVIERFAKKYPHIRLIRNAKNMGPLHNSEILCDLATGDYLYSTAADDRVLPGFFERSLKMLRRHPSAAVCFSDPATFGEGRPFRCNSLRLSGAGEYFSPQALVQKLTERSFPIAGHTSIVRRQAWVEAGGLLPQLKWHSDWFMLWVLAFRHGACYVPEALASLRLSAQSYSASGRSQSAQHREVLRGILDLLDSRFSDVAPSFAKSGVLASLDGRMVMELLKTRPHRRYLTLRLLRRVAYQKVYSLTARAVPQPVKRSLRPAKASPNA